MCNPLTRALCFLMHSSWWSHCSEASKWVC